MCRAAGVTDQEPTTYGPKTTTSVIRNHLFSAHADTWIEACDRMKITIGGMGAFQAKVAAHRAKHAPGASQSAPDSQAEPVPEFSREALLDAIADLVIVDDLSVNIIESPRLRKIILMCREELKNSDIPHRTTLRTRIDQLWEEHIQELRNDFKHAAGKVSLTADLWTDPNLSPYMAVTAHWIEIKEVQSPRGVEKVMVWRADLIAFHRVPGRHTGNHLAAALLHILDRLKMTSKIGWLTLDNATNNDTMMTSLAESLNLRGIPFVATERQIRCFPHITNLACQAVLCAIGTDLGLAAVTETCYDIRLRCTIM